MKKKYEFLGIDSEGQLVWVSYEPEDIFQIKPEYHRADPEAFWPPVPIHELEPCS